MALAILGLLSLALVGERGGAGVGNQQSIPVAASPTPSPPPVASGPNLLTPGQADFRPGVGRWVGTNAVLTWTPAPSRSSTGALEVTAATPRSTADAASSGDGPGTWTPAVPGQIYFGSVFAMAGTQGRSTEPVLVFRSADGTPTSSIWGQGTPDKNAGWVQTAPVVGVAPAGTSYVELAILFYGAGQGEIHYLSSPVLTTSRAGSPPVAGPLRTVGNQIVDANGRKVELRGIQRYGLEADSYNPNFDANDIAHAKQWGANFIRISLGEERWLAGSCGYDPSYMAKVDSIVRWVTQLGMVALLDLHFNTVTPCSKPGLQEMADAPNAITFWRQVAARYASDPLVAFDLYNEPHGIPDAIWRNGGLVHQGNVTFLAAGMQQLYDAVRGVGASNLVFVSGNQWATKFPGDALINGHNLVYAVHAYTCPQASPPSCSSPDPYDPPQLLNSWVGPSATVPVVITEFGWPDRNDGRYITNVINFAHQHGWGWSVFAWDGNTAGQFDLLADVGPGANYEPSPAGMAVIAGLVSGN
jgi:hypothetical protein